jgi:hypothetical protein
MANTTAQNLVAFLDADSAIDALVAARIYMGHVPQSTATPYLYVAKRGEEPWDDMDVVAANPFRESFTIEAWGDPEDIFGTTGLGYLIRKRCQGHGGTMGSATVQRIEVADNDDEYQPRGASGDEGLDYAALEITITNRHAVLT